MEIHQAVADFSEDLVLAYLRERSEAIGIPTTFSVSDGDGDGRDTCSSDDDRLEANREYDTDRKTLLERNEYWDETERHPLERHNTYKDETERKHSERYAYRDETERKSIERNLYRDEVDRISLERNARRDETETKAFLERECKEMEVRCTTSVRAKHRATSIDSGVVCVDAKRENVNRVTENEERDASRQMGVTVANERCSNKQNAFVAPAGGNAEEEEGEAGGPGETTCGNSLVLAFRKGDVFAVVDADSAIWWGVLALRSARVGYVPSTYLKFLQERHLWLTRTGEESSRDVHMKAYGELQKAASRLPHPEVVYGAMIPEPDYSDDETTTTTTNTVKAPTVAALVARNNKVNTTEPSKKDEEKPNPDVGRMDENGLIMPKKLVNPCLESSDKKNLHRELLFNQKRGVNVLNQKTELQKAMERHKDKKVLKEQEMEKTASKTPFQKALDERAQKIEQMEKADSKETENGNSACEFQKIHAKVRAKMEVQ